MQLSFLVLVIAHVLPGQGFRSVCQRGLSDTIALAKAARVAPQHTRLRLNWQEKSWMAETRRCDRKCMSAEFANAAAIVATFFDCMVCNSRASELRHVTSDHHKDSDNATVTDTSVLSFPVQRLSLQIVIRVVIYCVVDLHIVRTQTNISI